MAADPRLESVAIIGSGASGLITAYTLIQDGFLNVQILTRDRSAGGTWARERIYPSLKLNNVHGEFRFSPLSMKVPGKSAETGGRLTGEDMRDYMEAFADKFLKGRIRFETEVLNIRRHSKTSEWVLSVRSEGMAGQEELNFSRIVLCSGGCSSPKIPDYLSPATAIEAEFKGLVVHAMDFFHKLDDVLSRLRPISSTGDDTRAVIVGCGKSAQDVAAYLANEGRKVSVVFETPNAFLVGPKPLPDFIRKSRFLSAMSPHTELKTTLERFLHGTWVGSKLVHKLCDSVTQSAVRRLCIYYYLTPDTAQFDAYSIGKESPLRLAPSPFWSSHTDDEGIVSANSFHGLVSAGKIELVAPTRVQGYHADGHHVLLKNGDSLKADVVVLATGFVSSWKNIFDESTANALGINRHPLSDKQTSYTWDYPSLRNPPSTRPGEQWASSIYRGLVPAKNISRRDFAINGAVYTPNHGYTSEVASHWISSYFLRDSMRLPSSVDEALAETELKAAWMRKRWPGMSTWDNESYSSGIALWNWPQAADELLEDMGLRTMRSGGNWLTWPFKVVDLGEIATLGEERKAKRHS
ncbi:FAD/NAD-P-binding domain-containing protein [Hygrophoropsis aurantiaca]|uniref:FAD/NAD-P-binding domain-containing protein n=1 Tax=Hygrophoropsis aurantiaca TaxID=72124 RepID=A0ACB8A5T4_9AGAM|nr:FAD/NAD-P-binding domain-containing protein [Hygrophoropsis aurantiaca]